MLNTVLYTNYFALAVVPSWALAIDTFLLLTGYAPNCTTGAHYDCRLRREGPQPQRGGGVREGSSIAEQHRQQAIHRLFAGRPNPLQGPSAGCRRRGGPLAHGFIKGVAIRM